MKVNVITPVNRGGPYNWGKSLVRRTNQQKDGHRKAHHTCELKKVLQSPFYPDGDIVHTAVPITFRLWKKPVVLTIHGEYPIERNLWRRFFPISIKMADVVTTPSRFLKERLCLDDAVIIPNAVFPDQFEPVRHREGDTVNIVTLTKFSFKDKAEGVLDLIRIVEQAGQSSDKKLKYTVVGGGKYLEEVKKKSRGIGLDITFTGFLDAPQEVLKNNDIFLYYSVHDNFPIAILEAMAMGLPVVTNDVGAVREMIRPGVNGYVADSDEDYRERLSDLVADCRLRARLGQNARAAIESQFSWDRVINDYLKIYDGLC